MNGTKKLENSLTTKYIYLLKMIFGHYEDQQTWITCAFKDENDAEFLCSRLQKAINNIARLNIASDLPWGLYYDNKQPSETDWKTLKILHGKEVHDSMQTILAEDSNWLGLLHNLEEYQEPTYMILEIKLK